MSDTKHGITLMVLESLVRPLERLLENPPPDQMTAKRLEKEIRNAMQQARKILGDPEW